MLYFCLEKNQALGTVDADFIDLEKRRLPGTILAHLNEDREVSYDDPASTLLTMRRSSFLIIPKQDQINSWSDFALAIAKRRSDSLIVRVLDSNLTLTIGDASCDAIMHAFLLFEERDKKPQEKPSKEGEPRVFGIQALPRKMVLSMRAERKDGLSLREIAKRHSVSLSTVAKYTRSVTPPPTVKEIAQSLGFPFHELNVSPGLMKIVRTFLATRRCDNTRKTYFFDLKRFFKFLHEQAEPGFILDDVKTITPQDYEDFFLDMSHRGCKPSLIRRTFSGISAFNTYLVKKQLIERNHAKLVSLPNVERYEVLAEPFNKWELNELLKAALAQIDQATNTKGQYFRNYRNFVFMYILADIGSRAGAVLKVKLNDVITRYGTTLIRLKGKGRSRAKEFSVSNSCAKVIHKYIETFFDTEKTPNQLLFTDYQKNHPLNVQSMNRAIDKVVTTTTILEKRREEKRALKITTHCFRTTWATQQEFLGKMSLQERQTRLDHSDPKQTMCYTKIGILPMENPWIETMMPLPFQEPEVEI